MVILQGGTLTAGPTLSLQGASAEYGLSSTGGNALGNSTVDLLLTKDNGSSFVIDRANMPASLNVDTVVDTASIKRLSAGRLISLGDIDGDGLVELGASGVKTTDSVVDAGATRQHAVGRVFLGSELGSGLSNARLVIETDKPLYVNSGTSLDPLPIGGLGRL